MAFYDVTEGTKLYYRYFLLKPNEELVGELTPSQPSIKMSLKEVPELTFTYNYYDTDGNKNPNFDLIKPNYLIQVDRCVDNTVKKSIIFTIVNPKKNSGDEDSIEVSAFGLTYSWRELKVRRYKQTRKLYDSVNDFDWSDRDKGGHLNYILKNRLYNTWTINYINSTLLDDYKTFDISESSILEWVNDIQSQWNCVFVFDYLNKTIDIKTFDELNNNNGLIISDETVLKNIQEQAKDDSIVTRLTVIGKNDVDTKVNTPIYIGTKNPTGEIFIDNFGFYRSLDFMSQSLLTALDNYDATVASKQGDINTQIANIAGLQSMRLTEVNELSILENKYGVYQYNANLLSTLDTDETIADPEAEDFEGDYRYWKQKQEDQQVLIDAKINYIGSIDDTIQGHRNALATLQDEIAYVNNFTNTQLQELVRFIHEKTIEINTSNVDTLWEIAQDLSQKLSTPQIEYTNDIVSILDSFDYQHDWDKIQVGEIVNIDHDKFGLNVYPVRIMEYTHNPEDGTISVLLSNQDYKQTMSEEEYIAYLLTRAARASTDVGVKSGDWDGYSNNENELQRKGEVIEGSKIIVGNGEITESGINFKNFNNPLFMLRYLGNKILASDTAFQLPEDVTKNGFYPLVSHRGIQTGEDTEDHIQVFKDGLMMYNKDGEKNGLWLEPTVPGSSGYADLFLYYQNQVIFEIRNVLAGAMTIRGVDSKDILFHNTVEDPNGITRPQGKWDFTEATEIIGVAGENVVFTTKDVNGLPDVAEPEEEVVYVVEDADPHVYCDQLKEYTEGHGIKIPHKFACNNATPQGKATLNSALKTNYVSGDVDTPTKVATELNKTNALLNQIRALLIANGQAQ